MPQTTFLCQRYGVGFSGLLIVPGRRKEKFQHLFLRYLSQITVTKLSIETGEDEDDIEKSRKVVHNKFFEKYLRDIGMLNATSG
jgi:hypothetical protein